MSDILTHAERAAIDAFSGDVKTYPPGAFSVMVGSPQWGKKLVGVEIVIPSNDPLPPPAILTGEARDQRIVDLARKGLMYRDIADHVGLVPSTVATAIRRLGVYDEWVAASKRRGETKKRGQRADPARDQVIMKMFRDGARVCDIARRVGITSGGLKAALKRLGLRRRPV
jgi:DNA-binding NarL/FixJ family response regulator